MTGNLGEFQCPLPVPHLVVQAKGLVDRVIALVVDTGGQLARLGCDLWYRYGCHRIQAINQRPEVRRIAGKTGTGEA